MTVVRINHRGRWWNDLAIVFATKCLKFIQTYESVCLTQSNLKNFFPTVPNLKTTKTGQLGEEFVNPFLCLNISGFPRFVELHHSDTVFVGDICPLIFGLLDIWQGVLNNVNLWKFWRSGRNIIHIRGHP